MFIFFLERLCRFYILIMFVLKFIGYYYLNNFVWRIEKLFCYCFNVCFFDDFEG